MKIEIATKELPGGGFKGIVKGSIGTTKVWHYTEPCFNTATAAYEAKKLATKLFGKAVTV